MLPVGWNKLYELVNSKGFPKFVVGRRILIPRKQFEAWLEKAATEQSIIC
jgi:excisionase family DNA binding protein